MKNLIATIVLTWALTGPLTGQLQFYTNLGISPGRYPTQSGLFVNRSDPANEFYFNLVRINPQYYAAAGIHVPLSTPFFLETGLTYTRQEQQYLAQYTFKNELRSINDLVIHESMDHLYLPVNIGVGLGPVEVTSGLKVSGQMKSNHEFNLLEGFSEDKKMLQMGWQMGVRAGIEGIKAGIEFHGGFRRVGQDRYINGHPIAIRNIPGNFVFSLQFRL